MKIYGFFQVPNYLLEIKGLTTIQKMVLISFLRAGNNDAQIFPSYKTIARRCSISESTAKKTVKKLESMNILNVKRRIQDNRNTTNLYTINRKELERMPAYTEDKGSVSHGPGSASHGLGGVSHGLGVVRHTDPIKNPIYKEPGIKKKPNNFSTCRPTENYDHLAIDLFADDT